jgi:carboxyl-terminal processing protease
LADEIIKRYYFERGSVQAALNDNPDLDKAIEVLRDTTLYNKVFEVVK